MNISKTYIITLCLLVAARFAAVAATCEGLSGSKTGGEDLCGPYDFTYRWLLDSEDDGKMRLMLAESESPDMIEFRNIEGFDMPVTARVDEGNKTVTFVSGDVCYHSLYEQNVRLQCYMMSPDIETGNIEEIPVNSVTGQIGSDGSIAFERFICDEGGRIVGGRSAAISLEITRPDGEKGRFIFCMEMSFEKIPYFSFDASRYTRLEHPALFTDNVVSYLSYPGDPATPQEVVAYVNADNTEFVIENPYGADTWRQINRCYDMGVSPDGYIVIDVAEPEVAMLRPMAGSGFWIDNSQPGDRNPVWEELYIFNNEGKRFWLDGYSIAEIKDEIEAGGDETSYLDRETNTVYLRNVFFGLTSSPVSMYFFSAGMDGYGDDVNAMSITVRLPDLTGVEEVETDSGTPVRYYNLQGMMTDNPAKGQLVIKTDGKKTWKTIFR